MSPAIIMHSCLLLFLLPFGSAVLPMSLGCTMDTNDATIRCRSSSVEYIVRATFVLVPEPKEETNASVNGSSISGDKSETRYIIPHEMDIFNCDIPELPNIFSRFNSSLERIRVARSGVQLVTINAFTGLESRLRYLDLSGNRLQAVPLAIQNLTLLEVLNLRDNKIQAIAEGPTFTNTLHLRELHLGFNNLGFNNLGYIDNNMLQISGPSRPQQPPIVGLAVFNLGNATHSLEIISLRGNGMHTFPAQLTKSFPRLKSLDLSFNSLIELPDNAFQSMPELQFVNLDSNLIRTLTSGTLPATLKVFTMKNNPLRCDCDIKWILEWLFTNTSLTVLLPKCNAPFHLRDISLLRLTTERLCHQDNDTRQTIYVTDRDLGYFPMGVFKSLKLLDVHGGFKSLFVSWKIDPQFYLSQREWILLYRRFEDSIYKFNKTAFRSNNYSDNNTDWSSGERVFSDSIRNLTTSKYYQVCIAVVENNINYVHLNHCRVAQAEKEIQPQISHEPSDTAVVPTTVPPVVTPEYLVQSDLVKIKADLDSITVYWRVIVQSQHTLMLYKDKLANVTNAPVSSTAKPATSGGIVGSNSKNGNGKEIGSNAPAPLQLQRPDSLESPLVLDTLAAIYNELQWRITYRKFGNEDKTAVTIMKNNYVITGPNTHQYTIANLLPGIGYEVCFKTLGELPQGVRNTPGEKAPKAVLATNNDECREILTAQVKTFPSSEVAVSCAVSILVTAVVVSTLWCIVPRIWQRRRQNAGSSKSSSKEDKKKNKEKGSKNGKGGLGEDEDDDSDPEDIRTRIGQQNGHLPAQLSSGYPRLTVYPKEGQMDSFYYGSLRTPNGFPKYPSIQRNGTYPRSILKKSPSAPVLNDSSESRYTSVDTGQASKTPEARGVESLNKLWAHTNQAFSDDDDSPITIRIQNDNVELKHMKGDNKSDSSRSSSNSTDEEGPE